MEPPIRGGDYASDALWASRAQLRTLLAKERYYRQWNQVDAMRGL
jgi:hypothetical protein